MIKSKNYPIWAAENGTSGRKTFIFLIRILAFKKIRRDGPCTYMKQRDVQVLFPHTRYTEVYI